MDQIQFKIMQMNVSDLHCQVIFHLGFHKLQMAANFALCGTLYVKSSVLLVLKWCSVKKAFFFFPFGESTHTLF